MFGKEKDSVKDDIIKAIKSTGEKGKEVVVAAVGTIDGVIEVSLKKIMDKLYIFQKSKLACPENEETLKRLREAAGAQRRRTEDRIRRGVEGKLEK